LRIGAAIPVVLALLFSPSAAFASEPPSIDEESVSGITPTNAILEAQISPHGGFGAYVQFQLVTDPEEYASGIFCPEPPESGPLCIGPRAEGVLQIWRNWEEPTQDSFDLSEVGVTLQPGTTYHYRVLAARALPSEDTIEWEEPTVFGPDHTFTTPSSGFPLMIAKTGEGTVVSNPAGIDCGGTCEANFEPNAMVTLTASPASGYAFSSWGGCTEHAGLTCKVKMEKAKTVKATFVATPSLTIEKAGSGYGKVSATGISCDESCSKATAAIKTGTSVTVKAAPAKGSEAAVFEGGTGSAATGCSGASCTFTISAASSVKVKFAPTPTHTLTVNLTGPAAYKGKVTGKGTVKGQTAAAILCGSGCTTETESFFATGTTELAATAATSYTFAGWSGGGCSGIGACTVATSSDKTVSAEFK
jgi:hypothetical protein